MKIDFINISGWEWVKESALTTIHKKHTGKEITPEWKRNILLSGHSPIRELSIRFRVSELERWIADQLVRHTVGVNNYMGTGRSDRIKIPRSEQTMEFLTELMQTHNAQSLIQLMNTRLCVGCVSPETRKLAELLRDEIERIEPELAFMFVPNCIKLCGCKEVFTGGCLHFNNFVMTCNSVDMLDIEDRYSIYHNWRKECQHR